MRPVLSAGPQVAKQMTLCLGQQLSQRLHELAELEGCHVKHQAQAMENYVKLPLSFEENSVQIN